MMLNQLSVATLLVLCVSASQLNGAVGGFEHGGANTGYNNGGPAVVSPVKHEKSIIGEAPVAFAHGKQYDHGERVGRVGRVEQTRQAVQHGTVQHGTLRHDNVQHNTGHGGRVVEKEEQHGHDNGYDNGGDHVKTGFTSGQNHFGGKSRHGAEADRGQVEAFGKSAIVAVPGSRGNHGGQHIISGGDDNNVGHAAENTKQGAHSQYRRSLARRGDYGETNHNGGHVAADTHKKPCNKKGHGGVEHSGEEIHGDNTVTSSTGGPIAEHETDYAGEHGSIGGHSGFEQNTTGGHTTGGQDFEQHDTTGHVGEHEVDSADDTGYNGGVQGTSDEHNSIGGDNVEHDSNGGPDHETDFTGGIQHSSTGEQGISGHQVGHGVHGDSVNDVEHHSSTGGTSDEHNSIGGDNVEHDSNGGPDHEIDSTDSAHGGVHSDNDEFEHPSTSSEHTTGGEHSIDDSTGSHVDYAPAGHVASGAPISAETSHNSEHGAGPSHNKKCTRPGQHGQHDAVEEAPVAHDSEPTVGAY
ncbi:hypothetical protein BDF22DRAFT_665316 [Syncephalis plumigaleata]|nr:hypothetical protein BDF22DRAFT_665316 [Syncephalis plumigaleata]